MAGLGSIAGAITGGILGGSNGSSPSGTTTRTEDVPDWLKPYYQSNLSGAATLRDNLTAAGNPLLGLSADELGKTIRGDYLNPDSNPYLAATGHNVADMIGRSVDSRFSSAGRYGSNAFQDTLSTNIGKALTDLYGANYSAERGRQVTAELGTPGFVTGSVDAQFAPYTDFTKLIPGLKTTTEPYFQNKGAGILGGALAGSQLGGMFGGFDLASILGGGGAAAGGTAAAEAGAADLLPYLAVMA